eukprot:scaffold78782_cov57-Phaeocystis_antarctica.AAC.1
MAPLLGGRVHAARSGQGRKGRGGYAGWRGRQRRVGSRRGGGRAAFSAALCARSCELRRHCATRIALRRGRLGLSRRPLSLWLARRCCRRRRCQRCEARHVRLRRGRCGLAAVGRRCGLCAAVRAAIGTARCAAVGRELRGASFQNRRRAACVGCSAGGVGPSMRLCARRSELANLVLVGLRVARRAEHLREQLRLAILPVVVLGRE